VSPDAAGLPARDLCREAAAAIEFYERTLAQPRRDMNDEIREGQRAAGEAYAEGRHDASQEY
jgi:hypothetical protein